jgi:hypothetical protein
MNIYKVYFYSGLNLDSQFHTNKHNKIVIFKDIIIIIFALQRALRYIYPIATRKTKDLGLFVFALRM